MENLDSDFNVLKIDRNLGERKAHHMQDNHPFVC